MKSIWAIRLDGEAQPTARQSTNQSANSTPAHAEDQSSNPPRSIMRPEDRERRNKIRMLVKQATTPSAESAFLVGWTTGGLSAAIVAIFISQNTTAVNAEWLVFTWTVRLWILLLIGVLVGVAAAVIGRAVAVRIHRKPSLNRPTPVVWIVTALVGAALIIPFLVQNVDRARYKVLWFDVPLPLSLSVVLAVMAGVGAVPVSHLVALRTRSLLDRRDAARQQLLDNSLDAPRADLDRPPDQNPEAPSSGSADVASAER
ncbi:MAG TPA: hypothetical protein VM282_13285 [Acidimicrobiales bacterium]|nr:hypothetical protein [Acidimicrobiales bacterium]